MNRVRPFALPVAFLMLAGCVAVPSLDEVLANAARQPLTSEILAADGTVLASLHAEIDRVAVPLSEIPVVMRDAVISIEDSRFYAHQGVDVRGVIRALAHDAQTGTIVEGGSTITQQLVKNLLPQPEKTVRRKIREALIAHQLEQKFSKDEILDRYMNTVYFGRGAYGVATAARKYFGVEPARLTLVQSALLAGLIAAPSRYDPAVDPDAARTRRRLVLGRMRALGKITKADEARARVAPFGLRTSPEDTRARAAYFVDYVKNLIADDDAFKVLGATRQERENALFKGGLRIATTLDPRVQQMAEQSVASTLSKKGDPSAALVAMRPDGGVVAMVGGRDYYDPRDPVARFNLATQGRRQAGSAFKPFTLVAALERGIPLNRSYHAGSRITLAMPDGTAWSVHNNEGESFGSSLTLERATALSVNVVYAQVTRDVGAESIVAVARKMGIESPLQAVPSITLGTQVVSPLELTDAYATLASGGTHTAPHPIVMITDANGKVLWQQRARTTRALSPAVAAQANEALQDVMREGTGAHLQTGFPVAGKSGTTDEFRDAWFAGFSPRLVTAVWVGFARGELSMQPPRTRIRVYGASWPGEIWKNFMLAAHVGLPALDFPAPADLVATVRVDVLRGCLPNAFTPDFAVEARTFVRGTEPTTVCTEPRSDVIDRTPAVLGSAPADAVRTLGEAGLDATIARRYCANYPPGVVCAQSPAAGDRARVGDRATVWVSDDGAVAQVPMLLGMGRAHAISVLRAAGFGARVVEAANGDDGASGCRAPNDRSGGIVWRQDPCAGEDYGRGAVVTISVNP